MFTIGCQVVLRLGGWSPHVQTGFHVSRPTQGPKRDFTRTGLSPAMARLSRRFRFPLIGHWPGPRSLVTTNGVSVDVLSSSYLDISVRWVCLPCGINQNGLGFPIRKSADQSLLTTPHSLSQRVTSFIASLYQGIHQMLFKTLDRTVHESRNRSDGPYISTLNKKVQYNPKRNYQILFNN